MHVCLPVAKIATGASRQRQQPGRLKQLPAAQRLRRRQFHLHISFVRSILRPLPTGPRLNPTVPHLQSLRARRPVSAIANLEHTRAYADTPAIVDAKACTGAMLLKAVDACVLVCCPHGSFCSRPSLQVPWGWCWQPGARGLRSTREAEHT